VRPVLATCPDQASQADAVCRAILEHHERGIALRNQVVLFRAAHHSDLLEIELRRRNLPFVKYGGLRFLEAAHVRDLLAALRLLDNPFDEMAWMRVLQLAEGIGPASARRLIVGLGVDSESAGDPLARFLDDPTGAGAVRSNDELDLLAGVLQGCRVPGNELGVQIDCIAQGFEPMIRHRYDHPDSRLADFEALARLAVDYPTRDRFVAELTLDPPASTGDLAGPPSLDDDWLTLSTVHSAKGGEWDAVHLIHAADGAFPSDMATRSAAGVDEERRLFYVALTRARRHLHIYAPLRYHHGDPQGRRDDHSYALRTRFLPRELDDLLDHRSVRAAIDAPLPMAVAPATDIVDAALRELW
jgi:DNA helicase-2/ATP-dependent DNA helicase PcrA